MEKAHPPPDDLTANQDHETGRVDNKNPLPGYDEIEMTLRESALAQVGDMVDFKEVNN